MTESTLVGCPATSPGLLGHDSLGHPDAYPMLRDVDERYGDLGPDGRIGVLALGRWFEDVRVGADLPRFRGLVEGGGVDAFRIVLAAQRVERLARLDRGARYRVGLGVRRIGRSSFTYAYGVFAGERCVALGESVTVFATADRSTSLPEALREDLGDLLLDEPGSVRAAPAGPERRRRSAYTFGLEVRARVGDVDTNRHVNNVALASWYADAVAALHLELLGSPAGGPPPELAPTSLDVQYLAEVIYPGTYDLGVSVADRDAGSVRYACGLFHGDRCVGLADAGGAVDGPVARGLDRFRL